MEGLGLGAQAGLAAGVSALAGAGAEVSAEAGAAEAAEGSPPGLALELEATEPEPVLRESFTQKPEPLKMMPVPPPIRRRTGPPHSGQEERGASDIDWKASKLWEQDLHSYS